MGSFSSAAIAGFAVTFMFTFMPPAGAADNPTVKVSLIDMTAMYGSGAGAGPAEGPGTTGQGSREGQGYGRGFGMMGPGYGRGDGQGYGQGMMGQGYGQG